MNKWTNVNQLTNEIENLNNNMRDLQVGPITN
jgi:hypothetical protein